MNVVRGRFPSTDRDPARSYEPLDEADLERLGRAANAELKAFFNRNPHLVGWRDRLRVIALCQGGAEHYYAGAAASGTRRDRLLRGRPKTPAPLAADGGLLGLGPLEAWALLYDPPEYSGRAVDVAFSITPDRPDPVAALRAWLDGRAANQPDPHPAGRESPVGTSYTSSSRLNGLSRKRRRRRAGRASAPIGSSAASADVRARAASIPATNAARTLAVLAA